LEAVNRNNEFALAAVACGTSETAIQSLSPESYEVLLATVYEINEKGFFSYARRQRALLVEGAMIREMAAQALANPAGTSPLASPTSPPKPG
jgi:hypothetical protein